MNLELLKEIGLTDGEIKVYLALFKLGPSSTGLIVKESKVHSSKVYPILDRLIDKGLVSYIKEGNKTIYSANSATMILNYLDKLENKISQQKNSAETLIKDLDLMKYSDRSSTEATLFKGVKGLKTAYSIAIKDLKENDIVYEMFLPPVEENLANFFKKIITQLFKEYKVKQYMLFNEPCIESEFAKTIKNINLRIGVSQEFKSPAEICLYGNNVIISTSSKNEPFTVLIKSKDIADSFRNQFTNIWKQQVYTLTGQEGLKTIFNDMLNYKEIRFIGGNWGIIKYSPKFFESWNKEREKRKTQWFDLLDYNSLLSKEEEPQKLKYYEAKILPEQVSGYTVFAIYGNKFVTIIWKEEPIFNVIESPEIVNHYRKYFEYLWQQDVFVSHGFKALAKIHEKTYQELSNGEEYLYLGIPKYQPVEHHEFWKKDHQRRIKAGIKCRFLFNKDTDPKVLENRNSYEGCDARYMPTDVKTPSYLCIFKNTVMIAIPKKDPIAIEINNKEIADSFRSYFESFWKLTKSSKKSS